MTLTTTRTATRRTPLVPWPRAALAVVTVSLAVFLGLGAFAWHKDHGFAIDGAFRRWVLRNFDVYTRDDMVGITNHWAIIIAAAIVAGFALLARRFDIAALAAGGPLAATGLTEYVLKPLFDRQVPLVARMTGIEAKAYPSGHETAVSSVLVVLALLVLRIRMPIALKGAALLALTAYYAVTVVGLVGAYYHYLSDTIGALAVSLVVVLVGALLIDRVPGRKAS